MRAPGYLVTLCWELPGRRSRPCSGRDACRMRRGDHLRHRHDYRHKALQEYAVLLAGG